MKPIIFILVFLYGSHVFGFQVIGYWDEGWEQVIPPTDANMSIAFMGYSDVTQAIQDSEKLKDRMVGDKYLAIGGGNAAGAFSKEILEAIITDINTDKILGYEGIAFDVEMCMEENLAKYFSQAFSIAQNKGFQVLVTVSHSEPYGCKDSTALMQAFLEDANINYLSPQLYTTGQETQNNYTAIGTPWSAYSESKAAIIPSIVHASMYESAQEYFKNQDVILDGFIQWNNAW